MNRTLSRYAVVVWLLSASALTIHAQQKINSIPLSDALSLPAQSQSEEEEFIKPSRPGVANPAEIQKAGVLQVEYGYDGNFRAAEFRSEQTAPLTLRFAASSRVLLEANLDTVKSEVDLTRTRMTGVGVFGGVTVGVASFYKK